MTRGRQAGKKEKGGGSVYLIVIIWTSSPFCPTYKQVRYACIAKVPLIRGNHIAEIYIYQHDKTSLTQPLSFHRSEDEGTGANQTIQHSRSSHIVL